MVSEHVELRRSRLEAELSALEPTLPSPLPLSFFSFSIQTQVLLSLGAAFPIPWANKQADVSVWKGPILITVKYTPVKNPAKMLQRALEENWGARLILGLTRVLRNYTRAWSPLCGLRPVLEGLRGPWRQYKTVPGLTSFMTYIRSVTHWALKCLQSNIQTSAE